MRDIFNRLRVIKAISPKAIGTSGIAGGSLSDVIDTRDFDAKGFVINHGTAGATGDTTSVIVYESDSATAASFTSVADADLLGTEAAAGLPVQATTRTSGTGMNISKKIGYIGTKRYLRVRLYGTGHATGLVSADFVGLLARREPVAS
jgi:hypothetical protein